MQIKYFSFLKIRHIILLGLISIAAISCGGQTNQSNAIENNKRQTINQKRAENAFPMVTVPKMISGSSEAMEYMAEHFWTPFFSKARIQQQKLNDSSKILGVDTARITAAVTHFMINIIPNIQSDKADKVLTNLMQQADSLAITDKRLLLKVMQLGEYIYYHPNSPYRNEEYYIPVAKRAKDSKALSFIEKMQYNVDYAMLMKNRVGTKAADFKYLALNKSGKETKGSLYTIKAPYLIVFFNNPGCSACEEFLIALSSDNDISRGIKEGRVKVLAIYIDEQINEWKMHYNDFPDTWIYARDPDLVLRNGDIYAVRAIPSVYLLNSEKEVLIKDGSVESVPQIASFINQY